MTELTCIVCPRGCTLRIEERDGRFTVTGNACKRGEQFATAEMTCPTRTLCTTVRTVFRRSRSSVYAPRPKYPRIKFSMSCGKLTAPV